MYLIPKGEKIASLRKERKISAHQLSRLAGIGPYGITRMEKGIHNVHPFRAKAVARVLKCKVEEIFIIAN